MLVAKIDQSARAEIMLRVAKMMTGSAEVVTQTAEIMIRMLKSDIADTIFCYLETADRSKNHRIDLKYDFREHFLL